ncbi:MAG: hypothetical protein GX958_05690, partial [Desulfitobacterium sp.]|nr:hypothetical protein [Desulfitobacterium sp.]
MGKSLGERNIDHMNFNGKALSTMDKFFGNYGGAFVPETLVPVLDELEKAYQKVKGDPTFQKQF